MVKAPSQRFKFTMFSLSDFTDLRLVNQVLDAFDSLPDSLGPRKYGPYEPVKHLYNPTRRSEIVSIWLNEECAQDHHRPQSGALCLESDSSAKAGYLVSWGRSEVPRFNSVGGSATLYGDATSGTLRDFIDLATAVAQATDAVFGLIDREFPQTNNLLTLIDLKVRLPEPCWMMFFGAPYVELFGKDRLRNAPCHEAVELPSGHFRLMITSSPHEPVAEEARTRIREHFGRMAFTEPGRAIRVQKPGLVPSFDFRNVL